MNRCQCPAVEGGAKGLKGKLVTSSASIIIFYSFLDYYRDEQYRSLWTELENLTQVYCKNSERHQTLLSYLQDIMSHCASVPVARKTPSANSKGESEICSRLTYPSKDGVYNIMM